MAKRRAAGQNFFSRNNLHLRDIIPLTANQNRLYQSYETGSHIMVSGCPGTGKSFLALYLALKDMIAGGQPYKGIIIMRSVVPSREMGFLPGTAEEKAAVYEAPYEAILAELFGRPDAYEILKTEGVIEFSTTSYLRGLTFKDKILIVDEHQNMDFSELNTIMTRIGDNTRVMFCGDFLQTDLNKTRRDLSGYHKFKAILQNVPQFQFITMTQDDIVRSPLVKQYIISRMAYETEHE